MQTLSVLIDELIDYAKKNLELDERDENYARCAVLEILKADGYSPTGAKCNLSTPEQLLKDLKEAAVNAGVCEEYEWGDVSDRLMGVLSLSPSAVDKKFSYLSKKSNKNATEWFYNYCVKNDYVKKSQLDKNPRFEEGELVITINLAKPEFRDPKKAAAGNSVKGGYPKCVICRENEGFSGRGKRTLRTVSLTLGGKPWFWQYSPYGYFYQHGICVNCEHIPMHVDGGTFENLFDFSDKFPHYFIGCNAALERIGGSVLAHDHYQGGGEVLPLHKAKFDTYYKNKKYPSLTIGKLAWSGTVIRVKGKDRSLLCKACDEIRAAWDDYTNEELGLIAYDEKGKHNAVSPTVINKGKDGYEVNLILRSNITSDKYPDGVFHAHPEYHVIKKESIGLIEAQGLFILPGRLKGELEKLAGCIERGSLSEDLADYKLIYDETCAALKDRSKEHIRQAINAEIGSVCERILENTAVFKCEDKLFEFLKGIGYERG